MLYFAAKYGENLTSQNGENGIINECIRRIPIRKFVAVEFGAPNQMYCSNIFHLIDSLWQLRYYDPNPDTEGIVKMFVTPENVNDLPECSVLSIDIDGNDYNVWKAYDGQPDIVIIEINSSIPPTAKTPVSDLQHGTAYLPMVQLGVSKGYFLLCHTGNLIFVLNKHRHLFPEIIGDGISNYQDYFNTSFL